MNDKTQEIIDRLRTQYIGGIEHDLLLNKLEQELSKDTEILGKILKVTEGVDTWNADLHFTIVSLRDLVKQAMKGE